MQESSPSNQNSQIELLATSPVEERHIDFLLEEEFACNPDFLTFFIKAAGIVDIDSLQPANNWNCKAIRSVTTDKGESDVLVIYSSKDEPKQIAILIEDKIRAGFRPNQPLRYRDRGEKGKELGQWDHFWTCLVAPKNYANKGNAGFDARVDLERLADFFSGTDARTRFKQKVIQSALDRFLKSGIQEVNSKMTNFRAFYANEASCFFKENGNESCIEWELPRDAWWDDTWFMFRSPDMPKSAGITYKARAGIVDFFFRKRDVSLLQSILEECDHPSNVIARQTHKSASFRITAPPIIDFDNHASAKSAVLESFQAVRQLLSFYQSNKSLIDNELEVNR